MPPRPARASKRDAGEGAWSYGEALSPGEYGAHGGAPVDVAPDLAAVLNAFHGALRCFC